VLEDLDDNAVGVGVVAASRPDAREGQEPLGGQDRACCLGAARVPDRDDAREPREGRNSGRTEAGDLERQHADLHDVAGVRDVPELARRVHVLRTNRIRTGVVGVPEVHRPHDIGSGPMARLVCRQNRREPFRVARELKDVGKGTARHLRMRLGSHPEVQPFVESMDRRASLVIGAAGQVVLELQVGGIRARCASDDVEGSPIDLLGVGGRGGRRSAVCPEPAQ
jgi:hypothetical protein